MKGRIRVLHIIQNLNYGGMEKLLADVVCGIDRGRFETHVLTLGYVGRYGREMDGKAVIHEGPEMSVFSMLRPAALARCIRRLQPDVVHTHGGVWYKASLAARTARIPAVVHTEHGMPEGDRFGRLLRRMAARRTDVVVAVSESLGVFLVERLGVRVDSVQVIRNGVDLVRFQPRAPDGTLRRELGIAGNQPIIGSIGRLEPIKGYDNVIRAFARVRCAPQDGEPVLVLAGEGSMRTDLEALAESLGVSRRVFLLGWRDDPENLYAHFCCFVMGSWSEGTSVGLLEAMASGLAPVVTAVGGNPAVLGEELSDQAVPAGDVGALHGGVERILEGERWRAIGRRARSRAEREFDLGAMVHAYEQLYEGLATMRGRRG